MISLVFDTETTGAVSKADPKDPATDGIVQLYASLYEHDEAKSYITTDADGRHICSAEPFAVLSTIIDIGRPSHPKAVEVHGIDQARSKRLGVDPSNAAHIFEDFVDIADVLVAHNKRFDLGICGRFLHENGLDASILAEKKTFCTMNALQPVMRLTPKVYGDWKKPKLIEAYNHVFGRDFDGRAHDAASDSIAAAHLYFACLNINIKDPSA